MKNKVSHKLSNKNFFIILLFFAITILFFWNRIMIDKKIIDKNKHTIDSLEKTIDSLKQTAENAKIFYEHKIDSLNHSIDLLNKLILQKDSIIKDPSSQKTDLSSQKDEMNYYYSEYNSVMQAILDSIVNMNTNFKHIINSKNIVIQELKEKLDNLSQELQVIKKINEILLNVNYEYLIFNRKSDTEVEVKFKLIGLNYLIDSKFVKGGNLKILLRVYDFINGNYIEHLESQGKSRKTANKILKLRNDTLIDQITFINFEQKPFKIGKEFRFELLLDGLERPIASSMQTLNSKKK